MRSIRTTKSNASLLRSCLLTRSAHASQVQIVAEAASESGDVDYRSGTTSSPLLPQRRCQSLGRFPGEEDEQHHQQEQQRVSGLVSVSHGPRQFLCVPQVFPSRNKSNQRRRKESKSLDLFPSELRSNLNDRSPLPSCASQDDTEDEHSRLLGDSDDHNVVLNIPNGEPELEELSRPNGHIRTSGYQAVKLIHNDDEGIDVNSETPISCDRSRHRPSLTACGLLESEKRCEQLEHSTSGERLGKESKDTVIASTVSKSVPNVKRWIVNLFGVGHGGDTFSRNPQTGEEFSDLHRDDRESVV